MFKKNEKVVAIGEEEVVTDYNVRRNQLEDKSNDDEENNIINNNNTNEEIRVSPSKSRSSEKEFCMLDTNTLQSIAVSNDRWGTKEDELINWDILPDSKHITEDPFEMPDGVKFKKEIEWEEGFDLNDIFFQHFFPSVEGHAKIIDRFNGNIKSPYYSTVINDNIVFDDVNADDPDWRVKICYTIMIASASEIHNGVENL